MSQSASYWVVIPAAGSGSRYRSDIPKQYLELNGKTVLEHSIDCFLDDPLNKGVVIAVEKNNPWIADLPIHSHSKVHLVDGGEQRCHSVLNALWFLQSLDGVEDNTRVLVHDAARPCLDQQALTELLAFPLQADNAALLACPVTDTLKQANQQQQVIATVDRDQYWLAQTPQMAELASLLHAIEHMLDNGRLPTDEAAALEYTGIKVSLVKSPASNIKITQPGDLQLAGYLLSERDNK